MVFSIDQNCQPLWDVIPKLHALTHHGLPVRHFVEDIDVAFTSVGASVGDHHLRFAPERYHGSGGSDWGAAVFYSEFLSKQPTDLRHWEPLTGMSTAALARRLGTDVASLYDRYSPSGNYQLIGSSYIGDRHHHRVLGDLSVAELADHLRELMQRAQLDMTRSFPAPESQSRIDDWFTRQRHQLEQLIEANHSQTLDSLYQDWMQHHCPTPATIDLTSDLFALGQHDDQLALLNHFITDYSRLADIYDEAMREGNTGQHALRRSEGELPFYAVFTHEGHLVRAECSLRDGAIHIADRQFPLTDTGLPVAALRDAGIQCLIGKAALLTVQVRLPESGAPLALPYHGSMYMPSAFALQRGLQQAELLPADLHPVLRVRFNLLDRMAELDTPVRLPDYLAQAVGETELPACDIADQWRGWQQEASDRLDAFANDAHRAEWLASMFPDVTTQRAAIDHQRRQLAQTDPKSETLRELSHEIRSLDDLLLRYLVDQIERDWQVAQLDFWDSRGAIWPWCIALGGEALYDSVITHADVYADPENPTP
jgi:hypothetical protein